MKLGISIYCLDRAMEDGMSVYEAMDFAKENGASHIELVPFHLPLVDEKEGKVNEDLCRRVREHAEKTGLEISAYSVNADLLDPDPTAYEKALQRVKLHIDAAALLGLSVMRHDVAGFRRPFRELTVENFERDFPRMVDAVRRLYDYAAEKGITTTLENHGFYVNGSDRLIRLIQAADRPGLGMTLDVGNFLCVDEYSLGAVKKCLPYAKTIHLKDFYVREMEALPGQNEMFNCDNGSWFETLGGMLLRGAVLGQGDLPVRKIVREIVSSGFDGPVSIEFEGMEPPERATKICLQMARAFFKEAGVCFPET